MRLQLGLPEISYGIVVVAVQPNVHEVTGGEFRVAAWGSTNSFQFLAFGQEFSLKC